MKTMGSARYRAKEFAQRAGVTVRTLHLYDERGLLPPAERLENGYRLYGEAELERLEQIVALRFLGFNLHDIKELLHGQALPMIAALRMQREILRQQRDRLDSVIKAIARAESTLDGQAGASRWETLRAIIEAMKMNTNDWDWTKKYYSDEAREKIDARAATISSDELQAGQRAWTQLIAEVEEAAQSEDPGSAHGQRLAQRWKSLVREFTGGDASIQSGLNRLYSDQTHWPADFKRPWSDRADRFIKAAMNCKA